MDEHVSYTLMGISLCIGSLSTYFATVGSERTVCSLKFSRVTQPFIEVELPVDEPLSDGSR